MAKVKEAIKSNGKIDTAYEIEFVDIRQRHLEAWTNAFNDEGGADAVGLVTIASIYCRALVTAEILVKPDWKTAEDVGDADPRLCIAIFRKFDEIYNELTTIPKA